MNNIYRASTTFQQREQFIVRVVAEQSVDSALVLLMPWQQLSITRIVSITIVL